MMKTSPIPKLQHNALFAMLIATVLVCAMLFEPIRSKAQDAKLNDGNGYFKTKKYHNYFKDYGHTDKEASEKIEKTFQQLFYGDTAHATAFDAGKNENGPLMYVTDVPHYDIRTEGMSYGMMICVQLNKKKEFDAI